ncbi:tetratricopeptide repeat protein [Fluviispira multicolorata]|uniref:Tetratricopeptide repeat protein n=1 Tax=Fluviispira multicolorata TaxID=2654512 RepID=A0A833JD74_9BACT|nr:tetratricopeptide repeat protein [Fluviispira multicolorata]KAB8031745.1 tetratricopeptide repeat protein [Fluviispira multicolorata]
MRCLKKDSSLKLKSIYCIVFLIFYTSCQSQKTSNETQPNGEDQQHTIIPSLSQYAQIRLAKIIHDSETGHLTGSQADEAFLLGKSLEEKGQLETAEILFQINYQFSQSLTVGLNLVNLKIQLRKLNEAQEIANRLTVLYPKSSEPELALASIYQLQNNTVALTKNLEKAYKKYPNDEAIVIFYSSYSKKNSKKVLEDFLKRNPRSNNVLITIAKIYFQEKNYSTALIYAKKAFSIDQDIVETINLLGKIHQNSRDYAKAEKYFKLAFDKEMDNNLNAQNYVNILLFQNKTQEALSILLKLEKSSDEQVPFPPEFTFQIAKILLLNREYKDAEKRLNELQKINFENGSIKYYLAVCNEKTRNFEVALQLLNEIKEDNEYYSEALKAKIIILINTNQKDLAEKQIFKFTLSDKNVIEDTIFKSSILAYFNKYSDAVDTLNKSISTNSDAKELYLKKAEYLKYIKSGESSLQLAEKIVSRWPNYADGLNFLGYTLVEKNKKLDLAKKVLLKAVTLNPKNGFYLDSLGWLYYQKNDFKNAFKYISDALKIEPDEPVILYHLASAQMKLKYFEDSLRTLESTSKILEDMLPYQLESDPELARIHQSIEAKIMEAKKAIDINPEED